jgi:hypothetical protein
VVKDDSPSESGGGLLGTLWGRLARPAGDGASQIPSTGTGGTVAGNDAPASAPPGWGGSVKPTEVRPQPTGALGGPQVASALPELPPVDSKDRPPAGGTSGSGPMSAQPQEKSGTTAGNGDGSGLPSLPPAPPIVEKKDTGKKDTDPPPPPAPVDDPPPPVSAPNSGSTKEPPLRPIPADATPPVQKKDTIPPPPAVPSEKTPTITIGQVDVGGGVTKGSPSPATEEPIHVGRTPTASIPPVSVSPTPAPALTARGSRPDVISYTEEGYVASAGDSFKSISQAKYGTDRYAAALYHFNQGHPLTEDSLPEDGSLRPRQKVYVPPAAILESRYPEQIKAPIPAATVSSGPKPVTYRVAAGGEFQYEIARKQLGDGNRWTEIQKLNPGWRPEVPIPGGTTIQLPTGAGQ